MIPRAAELPASPTPLRDRFQLLSRATVGRSHRIGVLVPPPHPSYPRRCKPNTESHPPPRLQRSTSSAQRARVETAASVPPARRIRHLGRELVSAASIRLNTDALLA